MPQSSKPPEVHGARRGPLAGLRIVEISAFVAAPLAGMTLAQLGAEVIRIDPAGGNIDYHRWPVTTDGHSLYWDCLNKGKRSVTLDLHSAEGRRAAIDIICAPGPDAGIVVTNLGGRGWLDYETLVAHRSDLIMMRLMGNHDGSSAVDYSVNCASGFPHATGPDATPVNHVLPAWDIAAGLYLATGLLAAERVRRTTGVGQEVTIALSDVMLATVANLGYLADVAVNGVSREPDGNSIYGGFGRDFETADDRRVMMVAITTGQWRALVRATGLGDRFAHIEPMLDVDLSTDDGRFLARHAIAAVLERWCAERTLAEIAAAFRDTGALWGPYQTFAQLLAEDERCSPSNPMFDYVDQPSSCSLLTPASPLSFSRTPTPPPAPAPTLGHDTDDVRADLPGEGRY